MQDRNFQDNAEFFQDCFEVGRRFKIMNPDKMRAEYGKLIYMLMDSADDHIQNLLEFRCVRPLRTVYSLLEESNGLAVLDNPLVQVATAEIVAGEVLLIVKYLLKLHFAMYILIAEPPSCLSLQLTQTAAELDQCRPLLLFTLVGSCMYKLLCTSLVVCCFAAL